MKGSTVLTRFCVRGFKSLRVVDVVLPRLCVLFGPNAAGKSNFLDAVQALSRVGWCRTLADAMAEPIRGYPQESFTFPAGGLPALLNKELSEFALEADLVTAQQRLRYRVAVGMRPSSGSLEIVDEFLGGLGKQGRPLGAPMIERVAPVLRIRRKGKPAHPREEALGLNHTQLSDLRFGGTEYRGIEDARAELSGWRTYYLDPRVAMRQARPPSDVNDIGTLGQDIAPFLYRLRAMEPKAYEAIGRSLRCLIPSIENFSVDLDPRRGTLDINVTQAGVQYSSRIVSEGTLRVLALCCIAVNPWSGSLLAFEEPENGVHPGRIELIAKLLTSMSLERGKQLVITTHSPLFCAAVQQLAPGSDGQVGLFSVRGGPSGTEIRPFRDLGTLLTASEIDEALSPSTEHGLFENLLVRGLLDE